MYLSGDFECLFGERVLDLLLFFLDLLGECDLLLGVFDRDLDLLLFLCLLGDLDFLLDLELDLRRGFELDLLRDRLGECDLVRDLYRRLLEIELDRDLCLLFLTGDRERDLVKFPQGGS